MNQGGKVRRRGQPLAALVLLLVSWAGARAALWDGTAIQPGAARAAAAPVKPPPPVPAAPDNHAKPIFEAPALGRSAAPSGSTAATPVLPRTHLDRLPLVQPTTAPPPRLPPFAAASEPVTKRQPLPPRVAANNQLLWLAGMAEMTAQPTVAMAAPARPAPTIYLPSQADPIRWSADGWLLLRPGGNGFNLPGAGLPGAVIPVGFYGGSQAGLVLRYRLAPSSALRPAIYLRASSGIEHPRGEELAAGFSLRPIPRLPVALLIEGRATRTLTGTIVRPAAALVSELPPARLLLGIRGEAYVQAGYVGGRDGTAFVDGQARAEHALISAGGFNLRAGGGVWGGAQRGARRLDVGPTATLSLRLGPVGTRVSADYRFRIAGAAAPGSGPVVTLSAGF